MSDEHPTPWRFSRPNNAAFICDANGDVVVCWDYRAGAWPPEDVGYLMAAAPKLLFACKAMSYRVISEMNAMTNKWDPDWERLKRCLDMLGAALAAAEPEKSE